MRREKALRQFHVAAGDDEFALSLGSLLWIVTMAGASLGNHYQSSLLLLRGKTDLVEDVAAALIAQIYQI
jgi:hypothetical protein